MQPPPRKGNYAKFLKNLHSEQIAKLQLKNQHECDLLEDIRSFTIKRSAIEKSYSEALLKISSAYLNKKIPNIPDIKLDGGEEKWNMWNVWRTVLEENEKLAKARLAAVEVFQQQIADEAKVLRSHKVQASRKSVDQLAIVQKELQVCVQDVDKTKKLYFDEEHSAHDVRDKAKDLEEKLKKKKGSFFQSITSLQKNSAKFSSKRDQLEEKSTGARNDYLLCLSAANAHQNRYFVVDLQIAMSTMESGVFEKVAEYLTLMGRTELLTCSATQHSFGKIRDQAQQLTREYNLQCCYLYYPVLKQHIQYDFEACDNDPVAHVTADHESAAATLSKEARRWATRIARENNSIRENIRKCQVYNALREAGQKVDPNDQNGPDLETKIDDMRQAIRRSETAKMKAEARIECLRAGGVNVDEWMQEAETLSVQDIPRSASSLSVRTDASGVGDHPSSDSFYDSDFADGEPAAPVVDRSDQMAERQRTMSKPDSDEGHDDNAEVDAMLEQERQRIEQLTAGWDDPTQVDWGAEEQEAVPVPAQPTGPILKCTALYSYTAQNPDELSIVENEQLEVVGEGDGDGWLRARNYRGEEGYVPNNYLDVEPLSSAQSAAASAGSQAGPGQLQTQISFSSVDYTIDHEDDTAVSSEQNQSPEQISVISVPAQQTPTAMYCIALYDYEGDEEQELTFDEGQIIRITNKCAHGVDDGWWEGEFEGRIGNFPSLVVEECDENGEPITSQWDETPPCSAPPVLTPPELPSFLLNTEVVVTQPTPMVEAGQQEQMPDVVKQTDKPSKKGFAMALSKGHHDQYDTQFSGDEIDGIPCVVIQDEDGEETEEAICDEDDFGLCAVQMVITAATPMIEEPEHPFPPPEDEAEAEADDDEEEEVPDPEDVLPDPSEAPPPVEENALNGGDDVEVEEKSVADDQPTDSAPFPVSSSSEGETTGPSTAENSQSHAPPPSTTINDDIIVGEPPKQVVGGRASIPDELEPHQLARLQDLKESNA